MTSIPSTQKAVVLSADPQKGPLFDVTEIPTITDLNDYQLLVHQKAFAANPTDWKHALFGWGVKGNVVGTDSSGVVVKVGPKVEGFNVGDHVSSFAHGGYQHHPADGLFKEYAVVDSRWSLNYQKSLKSRSNDTVIPSGKIDSFEAAATITLGLVTIGGSFHHFFGLREKAPGNSSKYILILGGATATGFLAIQVAKKIYGLKVLATASRKNFEKLQAIGADKVFDYHDADVFDQIKAFAGEDLTYTYLTAGDENLYKEAYNVLPEKAHSYLDNIQVIFPSALTELGVELNKNVKLSSTLAYTTLGEDQHFPGFDFNAEPGAKESHLEFWSYVSKYVHNGEIIPIEAKILGNGLEHAEEAAVLLKDGKVSAQKLVFRP
ncbi:hypothetical protein PP7435_CHR2-0673 [Komagataella phaffii CBS 7435]|uniref:Enoyl reductase (ER) domain-containing protein n=2 Tax=Komagataella phaffii TaxID=460519 RepID=C4R174_KOMPG|nr:uncharacterized protein PAS_chr2-1_0867 [Komagataella phaffii GS115]AOA62388.1 GQ67_00669T0 [Komagataella phaffii]CAH2448225.1 hypothetical protein BQ9382_C2-3665 [Komagataella phaffii CBS 7435]AOA67206.1 GQ68_00719T0 [Komagataella phaffii GS115]CAY69248.1 hypothetical protein PAS_chr2-1_0867 [Komagataella phaffii GS115]CCA38360.1 hypothetical protein PP7435_CHR2-0673 [Komagataella phaffii CBS 7435]